jgi:hypothetical protein
VLPGKPAGPSVPEQVFQCRKYDDVIKELSKGLITVLIVSRR